MTALDVAQRYFDAWNRRAPADIVACFAPGGTYQDPATGQPLSGEAIGAYAGGLFQGFPDLSFDIVSAQEGAGGSVAAQWVMRGTDGGALPGLPPSGRSVALPGADFMVVEGDLIRSVTGYFDQRAFVEQLGLQVVVQPYAIGPFTFGTSVHVGTGKAADPAVVSLTALSVGSEADAQHVAELSRQVLMELLQTPGFISAVTGHAGERMYTVSLWESAEALAAMQQGTHAKAVKAFMGPDFTKGGVTGVWQPLRINAHWARCTSCGKMASRDAHGGACTCGAQLPVLPHL